MESVFLYYEGALVSAITTKMDLRKIVQIKVTPKSVTVVGVDGFSAVPHDTMQNVLELLSAELPKEAYVCNGRG